MGMESASTVLIEGQNALATADWQRAKSCFERVLLEEDNAEAHDGLGIALWWLNQISDSHQQRMAAYNGFKKQGAYARAARIAMWLGREQVFLYGNISAMQGWFARAERLLKPLSPCVEHGWFLIQRASMLDNPPALERTALQAMEIGGQFQDADLEAFALAFGGMARVTLGRVEQGMANLDEAMIATVGGEVTSFMVMSEIFCVMLSACEAAGDLARCEAWCKTAAEFAQRRNCPFLSAYCRTTYGGLMAATGRWQDAESELVGAIRDFEAGHRALRIPAVLRLADLRIAQGRLEEAEILLVGHEDHAAALIPLARLHLARGEKEQAQAVLGQAVGTGTALTLDHMPILSVLVEVLLAIADLPGAKRTVEQLMSVAAQTRSDVLIAQAELAKGRVLRAAGESDALTCFHAVLDRLRPYEGSLLASRARFEIAQTLKATDWAGAVTWGRAALAAFERLGAARDADEAANLLRQLGATGRVAPSRRKPLTQREAAVLGLIAQGLTNREIADRLVISAKTVEHHVSQVLGKLGLRSRTEAAAFAAAQDLSHLTGE